VSEVQKFGRGDAGITCETQQGDIREKGGKKLGGGVGNITLKGVGKTWHNSLVT